jgi:hypothetical protein
MSVQEFMAGMDILPDCPCDYCKTGRGEKLTPIEITKAAELAERFGKLPGYILPEPTSVEEWLQIAQAKEAERAAPLTPEQEAEIALRHQVRDEVALLMLARGWPQAEIDKTDPAILLWHANGAEVSCDFKIGQIEYDTEDDNPQSETGTIELNGATSNERIIAALDRLRWVLGLAEHDAEWLSMGFINPMAPQCVRPDIKGARPPELVLADWRYGMSPAVVLTPKSEIARKELPDWDYYTKLQGHSGVDPGPAEIERAARLHGRLSDDEAVMVAMTPAKPAPKEDPPFVPRKWGEHG